MPASLQRRLLLQVLGVLAGVWLLAALLTWQDVQEELNELLDAHLTQAASILVVQHSQNMDNDGDEDDEGIDTPSLHRYAPKVAFQIYHRGVLHLHSSNAPTQPMVAKANPEQSSFHTVVMGDRHWRVFATGDAQQDVQIFVGEELDSRSSIVWAVLRSALLPIGAALPVLALILWWAVHRGLAPIRLLSETLSARKPNALEPVHLENAPSEIAPMVQSLNALLGRIAELLESERRFTADASHELRTPIAAIRTQAQVALGETDDALRRHALQNTVQGCDRASHLVDQLLTLSRLEAASSPALEEVDLASLARQQIADQVPRALAKGQSIELEATAPCLLAGSATLLGVMLRNLLDNAMRYSPIDARILVTVQQQEGRTSLMVEDSGAGLNDADLARLGERFFRVQGTLEAGSGLGWSIIRRIASVHGLEVKLGRSEQLKGLSVTISQPS